MLVWWEADHSGTLAETRRSARTRTTPVRAIEYIGMRDDGSVIVIACPCSASSDSGLEERDEGVDYNPLRASLLLSP